MPSLLVFLSSSFFKVSISCCYCLSSAFWLISSFILASFLIFLALDANFKVDSDSPYESGDGVTIPINVVLQLPPKESKRILVMKLSLYGIWLRVCLSVNAAITFPSALRDLLIYLDSSKRAPIAPVIETLSDPAKSTKFSLPTFYLWQY
jgi:hypothetical protein